MKISVFPNFGNTCYLNSVLQCFIYNKKFKEIIKNNSSPFIDCLKRIIENIDLTDNNENIADIIDIREIYKFFPFKRFEQQDAHECIIVFLELLKEIPFHLYHGQTKTTIHCLNCKTVKHVFEDFNSINLNVNSNNLVDIFVKYLDTEVTSDLDNLYFCETCKSNQEYEKKIHLHKLPQTLILVLKKYTASFTLTEVPDKLKIKENGIVKDYKLSSSINHTGSMYYGHYTTYVILNDKCHFIDDDKVCTKEYDCKDNYILFYEVA
jgi:ubiquitin C-terminal hydrolase